MRGLSMLREKCRQTHKSPTALEKGTRFLQALRRFARERLPEKKDGSIAAETKVFWKKTEESKAFARRSFLRLLLCGG